MCCSALSVRACVKPLAVSTPIQKAPYFQTRLFLFHLCCQTVTLCSVRSSVRRVRARLLRFPFLSIQRKSHRLSSDSQRAFIVRTASYRFVPQHFALPLCLSSRALVCITVIITFLRRALVLISLLCCVQVCNFIIIRYLDLHSFKNKSSR